MGSDNRTANRRWIFPGRFHLTNSVRCGIRLLLVAVCAYSMTMLYNVTFLRRSEDDAFNASRRPNMSYLMPSNQRNEICHRQLYNVNVTCKHEHCYVVVVTVNMGFYDFFLNWYHYYNQSIHLHPNNGTDEKLSSSENQLLVVIAEDNEVYSSLHSLSLVNIEIIRGRAALTGNSDAEDYDSAGYKSLVSGRATHLLNLICGLMAVSTQEENSLIVVYSDIDTVWLRNPLTIIDTELFPPQQPTLQYDILAAVDDHDFESFANYFCTGLLAIASTTASISFLLRWEEKLKSNPQLNQPIFNRLLQVDEQHSIRFAGLDEILFPPGRLFFDGQKSKTELLEQTVVVHNNYIIGSDNKKRRFKEYGLWKT